MSEDNIAEMRKTIERLSKDKADLTKQVGDLTKANRVYQAKEAFQAQGFKPANGALYAAVNPEGEITPEDVVAFADEQGFSPVEQNSGDGGSSQESTSDGDDGSSDFSSMAGSGSRGGDGGAGGSSSETLTRQAWQELYARDPEAAKAAARQGRVQISKDNTHSNVPPAPGVNPFEAFTQADA